MRHCLKETNVVTDYNSLKLEKSYVYLNQPHLNQRRWHVTVIPALTRQ